MPSKRNSERLIIFLKYPQPGYCKTRLAAGITGGNQVAAQIYRQLIWKTITTAALVRVPTVVYATPPSKLKAIRSIIPRNYGLKAQSGASLGRRMFNAIHQESQAGYKKLILIGTDCPQLNHQLISRAFKILNQKDAVIGPCPDGGYYLIGFRKTTRIRHLQPIFQNITWSRNSVLPPKQNKTAKPPVLHTVC